MASSNDTVARETLPHGAESIEDVLRRMYHLRTLYDVSRELFERMEFGSILKNFLLMAMGNFGISQGFLLIQEGPSKEITHFLSRGFEGMGDGQLKSRGARFLGREVPDFAAANAGFMLNPGDFGPEVACLMPFKIDEKYSGLLALGGKLIGESYTEEDRELLLTLVNNLVVALKNAGSFEEIKRLNQDLEEKNEQVENAVLDLNKRIYHLKTLYDVSKDIFGKVDFDAILKDFLLMAMGSFGVMKGFILTLNTPTADILHLESKGYQESDLSPLRDSAKQFLLDARHEGGIENCAATVDLSRLPQGVACALAFKVGRDSCGLLGLGPKLIGEPYSEDDKELLSTLVNNLVVSLKNARSFEEIRRLNVDLQQKNVELQKALKELRAALRKVELLESIKANLSKFVPTTVSRLIEKSPTASIPEAREQDVSVLFLDIEGYTRLSERLEGAKLNDLIERYFSVFMDAIYANNGDVNETAGDGLMVLFMSQDSRANAFDAVRTALTIREKASIINQENTDLSEPLMINMGINSGRALLGAAKFESLTGSRWTYTARGMVTNVAARIGALASEGTIFVSKATAERVERSFSLNPKGKFKLKNVSEEVDVFELPFRAS